MIDIKSLEARISDYDCEDWTAAEGREIIARLRAAHDESVKLALATECGACMEIAFCGMTTCTHDCFPAISVEQAVAEALERGRQAAQRKPWWKRWTS